MLKISFIYLLSIIFSLCNALVGDLCKFVKMYIIKKIILFLKQLKIEYDQTIEQYLKKIYYF